MTEAQVRTTLGAPRSVSVSRGPLGVHVRRLRYPLLVVDLQRLSGQPVVVRLQTSSRRVRTAAGIGVGSRVERLQMLAGLVCNLDPGGGDCQIGDPNRRLSRVTTFSFAHDRVTLVSVALAVND